MAKAIPSRKPTYTREVRDLGTEVVNSPILVGSNHPHYRPDGKTAVAVEAEIKEESGTVVVLYDDGVVQTFLPSRLVVVDTPVAMEDTVSAEPEPSAQAL